MYRSSVTVVNAKITNFSFPEGQIKEDCNLNKFFQYIKSIGPHNDAKIQYELENSLDFYSQDSNNPSAFNCTLKAFSYASKTCFCNGAGKNFVDTLSGDILEALDITRAEMFVSLAVTSRKSLNLDLVWNAELLSSQLCGRMTRTLKLVISVT